MEGAESGAKKRILPQWMTEEKAITAKLQAKELKRKKDTSPRTRTVYCMNEMELVEYALEVLNEDSRQRKDDRQKTIETNGESEKALHMSPDGATPCPNITLSLPKPMQSPHLCQGHIPAMRMTPKMTP
ncbi:cell cycle regulator of non-homologous end joining [Ascaphus truei]|uniref:cell cycle regulator of non-homologous end joining n=1 Tax=Ascaphus truei TaxID=8439 RepID=UPI003F5A62F9